MIRKARKPKFVVTLATLLLAGGLVVGAPAPRLAVASGCGEKSGPQCRTKKSCPWLRIFKGCTTTVTSYYPR